MEKQRYRVLPGFDWVAGEPVPKGRVVALNEAEALYERGLGRIAPLERDGRAGLGGAKGEPAGNDGD